nr:hypothetical protein [Tanacetum cinerariifolium]
MDLIDQRRKDWCITYGALKLTSLLSEVTYLKRFSVLLSLKGKEKTSSDEKATSDLNFHNESGRGHTTYMVPEMLSLLLKHPWYEAVAREDGKVKSIDTGISVARKGM